MSFNRNDCLEIFEIGKELYLRRHARKDQRAAGRRLMDMAESVIGQMFRPDRIRAGGFTGVPGVDNAKRSYEQPAVNQFWWHLHRCQGWHLHRCHFCGKVASPQMTRWHLYRCLNRI